MVKRHDDGQAIERGYLSFLLVSRSLQQANFSRHTAESSSMGILPNIEHVNVGAG